MVQLGEFSPIWNFISAHISPSASSALHLQPNLREYEYEAKRVGDVAYDLGDFEAVFKYLEQERASIANARIKTTNQNMLYSSDPLAVQLSSSISSPYKMEPGLIPLQIIKKSKLKAVLDNKKRSSKKKLLQQESISTTGVAKEESMLPSTLLYPLTISSYFQYSSILPPPLSRSENDSAHIFIDNSNIVVGMLTHCPPNSRPKLRYDSLFCILERGWRVARRILVASTPLYQPLQGAERANYSVSVLRRVAQRSPGFSSSSSSSEDSPSSLATTSRRNTEQCVDELLQLKIFESLLDHAPATLVLATGDGKTGEFSSGFYRAVVRALERGWRVEIVSWRHQLSKVYWGDEMMQWGERGQYGVVLLDWFEEELIRKL
ncbi:uncharacterized protein VTP21DRAFT_7449 [Calcarisporiella thermophila]|uniref:uncharacterized protein n=1 Tax=Calcarisporiella thermophila TaxID=911321 RepID=UPI003741ECFC